MFSSINVARLGLRAAPRAARVQVSSNQMVARRWLNDNAGNRTDEKAKLVSFVEDSQRALSPGEGQ
jgi:hypothetical protein